MSRTIKFRAWDTVAKKYMRPWPEGFHLFGEVTCFDMICMELRERNPEQTALEKLNDIEIEQFTGLKDKNGVEEVYENDLMKDLLHIYKVVWDVPNARFLLIGVQEPKHQFKGHAISMLTKVGNIHENPELLEQSDGE
jgi:hypothetical protein